MASRKAPLPAPKGPTMSASKALPRLQGQLENAAALIKSPTLTGDELEAWETQTRHWLEGAFGEDDSKVSSVLNAGHMRVLDRRRMPPSAIRDYFAELLTAKAGQLNAVISVLEAEAEDEAPPVNPASEPHSVDRATPKKVFIVHGHDEPAKLAVALLVSKLKLEYVILHEQANRGKTIIEKFEANAGDIAYAVVLLTPDDRGGTAAAKFEDQQPRARQNVVFELGFFIGALGREKVCALHKPGTELPSDLSGVVYVSMDPHGAWKLQLAKEIKEVIPTVDMNDAM